jgi:5'-methylthioadenosine phosphorylase
VSRPVARLAVVGGHSLLGTNFAADADRIDVETTYGAVGLLDAGSHVVLQRHGLDRFRSAPCINHKANLTALADLGCDRVLALASVGGLRPELGVGTFLAPDDFIALHLGVSFSDGAAGHQIPGFDLDWRRTLLAGWSSHCDLEVVDGGVYWQTIGPRFETAAEIRLIAAHADVIGMTAASEAVLARELGIAYAAVCIVDNLANGIAKTPLTLEQFEVGARRNREQLVAALDAVVPKLVAAG